MFLFLVALWPQIYKQFTFTGYVGSTCTHELHESNYKTFITHFEVLCIAATTIIQSAGMVGSLWNVPALFPVRSEEMRRAHLWSVRPCVSWTAFNNEQTHILLRALICSKIPHQGLRLSSKQWAQESHSQLYKKSGSNLDSCIFLSRHTRHVSGITCWNNAVLIVIRVTLGKTTNNEQRQRILTLFKRICRLNLWLPVFALYYVWDLNPVVCVEGKTFKYSNEKNIREKKKQKKTFTILEASFCHEGIFGIKCISSRI